MAPITRLSQLDPNGTYSYADYLSWKFEQALEIIKGKVFKLAAPSRMHQKISSYLSGTFFNFFRNHSCEYYAAPFDVRLFDRKKSLSKDKEIYTVVQPDLCVICDLEKLDDKGCLGAPDLVVEILSPGNSSREMKIKRALYAESGVRDYWIVDPNVETVYRFYIEKEGSFGNPDIFVSPDPMPSLVFLDFTLDLAELFPTKPEPPEPDNEYRL